MNEEEVKTVPQEQENAQQEEKVVDELAAYKTPDGDFDPEKIKKLASDKLYYRQQISKLKQMPSRIEDYGKDFVLDSKFDEFISTEENKEKIGKIFGKIDKMCMDKGIGVERNADIRRLVLDELVENKVIDLTSAEQREAQAAQIVQDRNKAVQEAIGEASNVEAWNKNLYDWLKTFCNSEAEYELHKKLADTNSLWALSLNKIRQAQLGNRIPVVHSDPKFNETEWFRVFSKADREEQDRLLQERAEMLTKGK